MKLNSKMEHCVSDQTPCPKLTQYFSFIFIFFFLFFSVFWDCFGSKQTELLHSLLPSPRYLNLTTAQSILYPSRSFTPEPWGCFWLARTPKEQISHALPAAMAAQFPSKPSNSYCAEVPSTSQPLTSSRLPLWLTGRNSSPASLGPA